MGNMDVRHLLEQARAARPVEAAQAEHRRGQAAGLQEPLPEQQDLARVPRCRAGHLELAFVSHGGRVYCLPCRPETSSSVISRVPTTDRIRAS